MAIYDDNRAGGARRWATILIRVVTCGLVCAAVGCSQPVPESLSQSGEFFRRVGQLSMLKMAGEAAEAEESPPVDRTAKEGTVPKVTDSKIRLDLGMRLEEAKVSAKDLRFSVDDQVVVLEGTVASYTARDRVELIARAVKGVAAVENRLVVSDE